MNKVSHEGSLLEQQKNQEEFQFNFTITLHIFQNLY